MKILLNIRAECSLVSLFPMGSSSHWCPSQEENPDSEPLLAQDVPTHWNSTYVMLESFLTCHIVIIIFPGLPNWRTSWSLCWPTRNGAASPAWSRPSSGMMIGISWAGSSQCCRWLLSVVKCNTFLLYKVVKCSFYKCSLLYLMLWQVFAEATLKLSHGSACISEVDDI